MITKTSLQRKVDYINQRTGRPMQPWTRSQPADYANSARRATANVGNIYLNYHQPGGNTHCYKLSMMTTTTGVVSDLTFERLTAREMNAYLNGIIDTLDLITKKG